MKVILTGATGLLGQALSKKIKEHNWSLVTVARRGADIECDLAGGNSWHEIDKIHPDIIINAAANIDHASCEADPGAAYLINCRAVACLAELCRRSSAYFIHISTDHYYSGDAELKHKENAPVVLLNEYARSKYAGEAMALCYPGSCVVRTNVVGFRGWETPTFVEWIINSLSRGQQISAFDDYFTSSIDAGSLADAILKLAQSRPSGLINLACREVSSKKRFINALAVKLNLDCSLIGTGSLKRASLKPKRADSLGLDVAKAEKILSMQLPCFDDVIENLATSYLMGGI